MKQSIKYSVITKDSVTSKNTTTHTVNAEYVTIDGYNAKFYANSIIVATFPAYHILSIKSEHMDVIPENMENMESRIRELIVMVWEDIDHTQAMSALRLEKKIEILKDDLKRSDVLVGSRIDKLRVMVENLRSKSNQNVDIQFGICGPDSKDH